MKKRKNGKKATILFADIVGCSIISDNYAIEKYDEFLTQFHKKAIDAKRLFFPKFKGWTSNKIEFSVKGDETCLILHSGNKENDVNHAIFFAIFLKLSWLVSEENQKRVEIGKLPIELGIGINQGFVWYDYHLVDEGKKEDYKKNKTSEGYAINIAKRIESASRNGRNTKIFVSAEIRMIAKKLFESKIDFDEGEKYGELKGILNPPYLYEIVHFNPTFFVLPKIQNLPPLPPPAKNDYIEMAKANTHEWWSNLTEFFLSTLSIIHGDYQSGIAKV